MKVLQFPSLTNSSVEKAQNLTSVLEQKIQTLQDTLLTMPESADLSAHVAELKNLGNQIDQLVRSVQSKNSKAG